MLEIINTVLQGSQPLYIKRKRIKSFLTFELIEFMDKYDYNCQLFVAYNDTNIFTIKDNILQSKNGPVRDIINSCIRRWKNREAYLKEKIYFTDEEMFDKCGELFVNSIKNRLINLKVGEYKCKDVVVTTSPVATIAIHYNKNGKRQLSIKCFLGDTFYIKYLDSNFKLFIEKCLSKYCEIVWI